MTLFVSKRNVQVIFISVVVFSVFLNSIMYSPRNTAPLNDEVNTGVEVYEDYNAKHPSNFSLIFHRTTNAASIIGDGYDEKRIASPDADALLKNKNVVHRDV